MFELSPFEVLTENDGSYLAKNAISATKFDTPLKDIPVSLQVLNEAFLNDTLSLDLESAMAFSAAVNFDAGTPVDRDASTREGGRFTIRGFKVARVQRDGVKIYYAQDLTNIARVEVMKGPASLLYGEAQPGGIINYVPKRAFDEPRYSITMIGGTDSFFRSQLEATGPIFKSKNKKYKVLYRLDGSYEETDGWKRSKGLEKHFIAPLLEFHMPNNTKISLQYENSRVRRQTSYGMRNISTFTEEIWREQKAIEDQLKSQDPNYQYSDFLINYLFNGTNFSRVLEDSFPNGSFGPISVQATEDGRYKVVPFRNIAALAPQHRSLYAVEENGIWYLKDDPRLLVARPVETPGIGLFSNVMLAKDALIDYPYDFSYYSPDGFNTVDRDYYIADFQTSLPWDNWHVRFNSTYDTPTAKFHGGRSIAANMAGNGLIYRNSGFGSQGFWNQTYQAQLNISGKWDLARIHNQTILGLDYIHDAYSSRTVTVVTPVEWPSNALFLGDSEDLDIQAILQESGRYFDFDSATLKPFDISNGNVEARINTGKSAYISNLSSFWQDRIKVLLGVRRTERLVRQYYDVGWEAEAGRVENSKVIPQYGVIYAPSDAISFYASLTESFFPDGDQLVDNWDAENRRYTDEGGSTRIPFEGQGKEFGFKLDLFDSKISGTIAFFEVINKNVIVNETVNLIIDKDTGELLDAPTDNSEDRIASRQTQNGEETNTGIDADLIYSPTNNLQFVIGYALIKSETQLSTASYDDNIGVPLHQFTMWARYRFSEGALEGLSLGLGTNISDKYRVFAPDQAALENGGDTGAYYQDAFIKFDLQAKYQTKLWGNDVSFALNVKNVTDERYVSGGALVGNPREAFLTFRYDF